MRYSIKLFWLRFWKNSFDNNLSFWLIGFPDGSDDKEYAAMQKTWVWFLGQEGPLEKGIATHSSILTKWSGSEVKASACNAGDLGLISGSGRSPGGGNGNPLQYSCLENPMDGGAWWATVHGVAKSWTWLFFSKCY